ncbi:NAD(P)/FAD-dependent oxidoreductase [Gordonia sp. (in: high G+C Gram-positive bacteria)]|uniref:flavin-containing monooxygenase n=1 Tax=Gordonia sp. (in: high G+C Gram-positive bacteria) TaxID=84139 RepID=UPI0016A4CF39|nr:NAD(P)/FAD-dependent oxidoreductase [Gordonia sp. (in: high G+C Gram-positive bacteria)]NLG46994.1 NAD(P)/FAD-dependent oxidoreductase [Gordonia sp. (in: high G+C Gram-positive bacteria)]
MTPDPTGTASALSDQPLDVAILGAGISGIGAAHYLTVEHPGKTFAILESRDTIGGTWDLFRYPGIRSDSDLHTFGYEFKPWLDPQAIADAPRIVEYLREAVADDRLESRIVFNRRAVSADWSDAEQLWTLTVRHNDTGETSLVKARWVFAGTGYYNYEEGFTPEFAGRDRFTGQIIHPQHWPEDLDYKNKKVVVIGSGATAVTLVPSMADDAAHVTMLQRTPTYVIPLPREDAIANAMKKTLGAKRGFQLSRNKNILQQKIVYALCQRFPRAARKVIRQSNAALLPRDFDIDTHFNPPYNPWDQRLCVVPDGDLFKALKRGTASIVTGRIKTFVEGGIELEDGTVLEADIIVTATGLNLQMFGGMELSRNGEAINLADTIAYRGAMLSGIPNWALAIGYTNSSWTLKIGLLCEYLCRVLTHMDEGGYTSVEPVADPGMETRPLLDFGAGYVQRALDTLPKQGTVSPWTMTMAVSADVKQLRKGQVDDRFLSYRKAPVTIDA